MDTIYCTEQNPKDKNSKLTFMYRGYLIVRDTDRPLGQYVVQPEGVPCASLSMAVTLIDSLPGGR